MYKALLSFTTIKPYKDVQKGEILNSDFDTPEEIEKYLSIGYIEEYDGSLDITENGTYDVTDYEQAVVNVEGGSSGKYTPNFLTFRNYTGTDLLYETQNVDTKNISSFKEMFYNDTNLETIDISNWNTSNSTTFQNMFFNCSKLATIDVSKFNTSKATNMASMFYQCSKLINIDFSNSNLSHCIDFSNMFFQCGVITNIKMGEGVLNGEINFTNFARSNYKTQEIDLSGITFSSNSTINLMYAFTSNYALTKLDIRGFDTSKIVSFTDMIYRVPTTCLIIVGTDADKTWFATNFPTYTNVKTVAEYEAG